LTNRKSKLVFAGERGFHFCVRQQLLFPVIGLHHSFQEGLTHVIGSLLEHFRTSLFHVCGRSYHDINECGGDECGQYECGTLVRAKRLRELGYELKRIEG